MFERFSHDARYAVAAAGDAAREFGHHHIGTEHLLLGILRVEDSTGERALRSLGVSFRRVRHQVVRMEGTGDIAEPAFEGPVDFGWRGRPIVLAALGAGALVRLAFHPTRTGGLRELEMQILAYMALEAGDDRHDEPGMSLESLDVTLACDLAELDDRIQSLVEQGLLVYDLRDSEDTRVALTDAGVTAVQRWLARVAPLFPGWPTSYEGVDDATG